VRPSVRNNSQVADRRRTKKFCFSQLHECPAHSSAINDALDANQNLKKNTQLIIGKKLSGGQEYRFGPAAIKIRKADQSPAER
jgi:hypothetical protein